MTDSGPQRIVLASRSPQRSAILTDLGIDFDTCVGAVKELTAGEPEQVAIGNARAKARAVAAQMAPQRLVIGCDTVVATPGRLWGKPRDREQARATLRSLAAGRHEVVSGICLIGPHGAERAAAERTQVWFRALSERAIDRYLRSCEWQGRAGGYAIQGAGASLVARIEGSLLNVIGLPAEALLALAPELA